jgi:protein tyrosine phosphatase (PTP) superfamily phosphohydrolase (DUF442 family)
MEAHAATPRNPPEVRRRPLWTALVRGAVVGVVVTTLAQGGYVLLGTNFRAVVPRRVYRCGQPSGRQVARLVRRLGIRTVLNLRGVSEPQPSYLEESRATCRLNVSQEDIGLSATRLPPVPLVRELVRVLDESEYPILIHCHKGADRTGMVSAMYLLLYTDVPLARAREQLGVRTGHMRLGRTANIDRFFDLYEEWLSARGRQHSRAAFRRWAVQEYCPGEGRATIEMAGRKPGTLHLSPGRPAAVRLRCTNTSIKPWHFQPGTNAGIHLRYTLIDQADERCLDFGRAGLLLATVEPGRHIDLTLVIRPIIRPGRYLLRADLVDEQHAPFVALGNEPLLQEVQVP